ncbi:hypothetical protein VD0002_g446 [Verticillium dahliae]|uniref:Uncharacterized protein n=1 Tax=Verticillium dahliae TaxID=27337 RepID=A0AA45AJT0_VERDA|nr:hypothetical protein BJF96_g7102 [Verticillium dahliae]PNH56894.1 hypothetical protein VD0003_g857 [Verticillium dahliae]PNH70170.1 hypothetical protein VD0002_g446 [Verticillium dahliae]
MGRAEDQLFAIQLVILRPIWDPTIRQPCRTGVHAQRMYGWPNPTYDTSPSCQSV